MIYQSWTIRNCSTLCFIVVIKPDPIQLEEELISVYRLHLILNRWQSRSLVQGPGVRKWGRDQREILLTGLLRCFLIQPRPDCLGMVPPRVDWALLHQMTMRKCPINYPLTNPMELIPQLRFSLTRFIKLTTKSNCDRSWVMLHVQKWEKLRTNEQSLLETYIDFRNFISIFMVNKYCMYKFKVQRSGDGN